jgi:N6-adenosine-specific RNA methylase IME4
MVARKASGPKRGSSARGARREDQLGRQVGAEAKPTKLELQALQFHPLADIFPLLEGTDFDELVADVRAHDVREKIWLYQDKILDGRNRYRAATAAGVACPTRIYDGDDPVGFVISLNLKRRHLSESQRAMVAAKLATLQDGQRQVGKFADVPTQCEAAALLNVSERTVRHAREVHDRGAPELQRAVERDQVKVSVAADIATLSLAEQREILHHCDEREVRRRALEIRAIKGEQRRAERLKNLVEIPRGNTDLPAGRQWPILFADPPYRYEHPTFGSSRDIEERYPAMTLEQICALPVSQIAMDNALLFLFVPPPILEQGLEIGRAWGFQYRTGLVWDKISVGMGNYVRQQHEHLLIFRRGDFPTPEPALRPASIFRVPRREHSRKPDEAYELIERMYPGLPRIELFARRARPTWDRWGNEAPPEEVDS